MVSGDGGERARERGSPCLHFYCFSTTMTVSATEIPFSAPIMVRLRSADTASPVSPALDPVLKIQSNVSVAHFPRPLARSRRHRGKNMKKYMML